MTQIKQGGVYISVVAEPMVRAGYAALLCAPEDFDKIVSALTDNVSERSLRARGQASGKGLEIPSRVPKCDNCGDERIAWGLCEKHLNGKSEGSSDDS